MPKNLTSRLLWLATLVAAAVLLWTQAQALSLIVQRDWTAITFAYPLDYGEGPILDQVVRLSQGENIYHNDLAVPPYTIANYPPLFPLAQVPFVWAFGPAFWYGRALVAGCIVAAALFIGLTLHALTRDWLAALLGALMLPTFPYILHWSAFNRVDALALALSCAGLFVIARWPERRWGVIGAAALLTAAIFTRQSNGLAAPLAAFVWLFYTQSFRRALTFAALLGGACIVLLLVLNVLTGGGFFFNIVTANVNAFDWGEVRHRRDEMTEHMPLLLGAAGLFLLGAVWARARSWWLLAPYLAGATFTALTIGKAGSNVNYLFEMMAALSLVSGALIAWAARWRWLQIPLILLLALQVSRLVTWSQADYYDDVRTRALQQSDIAQLAQIVQASGGPVLTDEYMGLVPLAGQPLYFQPFEFKQLAEAGQWDEQRLVAEIDKHTFPVILMYVAPNWDSIGGRWTPALQDAIKQHYDRAEVYANTHVYRPRR